MSRTMLALSLFACAFLAACSSTQPPTAELLGISAGERSDRAIVLNLQFELNNPNDKALELRDLEYSFSVDGKRVFDGRRAAQATLPAHGWQQLLVPVVVPYDELDWTEQQQPAAFSYGFNGTLEYIAPGALADMLRDTGVWRPTLDISEQGEAHLGE